MRLIDVGVQGMEIDAILYERDGELDEALEARLDALLAEGAVSLENAAFAVRRMDSDIELCDKEIARLQDRKKAIVRGQDSLKGRMLFAIDGAFNGKLKTSVVTIYGQNSAATTGFELAADADLAKIAETDGVFVRRKFELDKQELKRYHDAGEKIPDGILVVENPGKRSLRIR